MNKPEAVELMINGNKQFKLTLFRLMNWQESKSIKENSELIGTTYQAAQLFSRNYKLKSDKSKAIKHFTQIYHKAKNESVAKYTKLWNVRCTMAENAKNLGVKVARARHISKRYNLSYTKVTKRDGARVVTPQHSKYYVQVKSMRELGMTNTAIGKIFQISKERVRQILNP